MEGWEGHQIERPYIYEQTSSLEEKGILDAGAKKFIQAS